MRVKYMGDYYKVSLDKNKIYNVLTIEKDWYRIIDKTGEDYLYPSEEFEIVEADSALYKAE